MPRWTKRKFVSTGSNPIGHSKVSCRPCCCRITARGTISTQNCYGFLSSSGASRLPVMGHSMGTLELKPSRKFGAVARSFTMSRKGPVHCSANAFYSVDPILPVSQANSDQLMRLPVLGLCWVKANTVMVKRTGSGPTSSLCPVSGPQCLPIDCTVRHTRARRRSLVR